MNNKGMTLVELIVTFSLLLVIIVGIFNLILEVKFQFEEKQIAKDLTEYSSYINNEIHYNLLKDKPFAIAYNNYNNPSSWAVACADGKCYVEGENVFFDESNLKGVSTLDKQYCKDIYPCVVYSYYDGDTVKYKTIGLNINSSDESNIPSEFGIYYNEKYESIPNQEFIKFSNSSSSDSISDKISWDVNNKLFILDFPITIIDNAKNYGFRIVYPFE